jgi:shikimate kinase
VERRENIVLIGMPGAGKSTVGVLLAKETGRRFVDTDVVIQAGDGRPLSRIIAEDGLAGFCRAEEQHLLTLEVSGHVVATGGSVVYSTAAMNHLREGGRIVYLRLSLEALSARLDNLVTRGVVMGGGQTLADVYAERTPLYETWAQLTVDCEGETQDQIAAEIARRLGDD